MTLFVLYSSSANAYHITEYKGASGEWYAHQTHDASEACMFDPSIESDCINAVRLILKYGYTVKAVQS